MQVEESDVGRNVVHNRGRDKFMCLGVHLTVDNWDLGGEEEQIPQRKQGPIHWPSTLACGRTSTDLFAGLVSMLLRATTKPPLFLFRHG